MSVRIFYFFVLSFVSVGVMSFLGVKTLNRDFMLALVALVFVYYIFCKAMKVSNGMLKLILPLFLVDYFWYRKFRPIKRRRMFMSIMMFVFFSQPIFVFVLKMLSVIYDRPFAGSEFVIKRFFFGQLARPVLYDENGVVIESVIALVMGMNLVGTILLSVVMKLKNYAPNLREALLRYPEYRNARALAISRHSDDVYRVKSDASVSHERLIERKNEITNAVGTPVIEVNVIGAGTFDFLIGELEAKRDDKGRYISKVKWESLEFMPRYTRRFLFWKKYNPNSRVTIPIGKSGTKTIYRNLLQTPHSGKIGISNSGKTSAEISEMASNALIDPQSLFIIVDIKKKGADFRLLEVDPELLFSPDRPADIPLWQWHAKCPKLANVFVIKSIDTFIAFVRYMHREIAYREKVINKFPQAGSLYDLEFENNFVAIDNPEDPQRLNKMFIILDDFLVIKEELQTHITFMEALKTVEDFVSSVRYLKIHIGFMSQKGTVKVLENARDQLGMQAFGTPDAVSEYVLKKKISVPAGIGVFGFANEETGQVGIACAAKIDKVVAARVLAAAEKKMFAWNRASANFLKACSEAEGDLEVMEGLLNQ